MVSPPDVAISFRKAREIGMRIPFSLFESATTIFDNEGKLARSAGPAASPVLPTRSAASAAEQRTPEQQAIAEFAETLIRELQAAECLVLGVPMYNFGIPSPLKAWFDHVARAGVTFRYTEQGPQGLLTGKRAVILASRGGQHRGQPTDTQSGYLRTMLGFLGITDVEFVYAEALNLGEEPRRASLAAAESGLERLPLAWGGVS